MIDPGHPKVCGLPAWERVSTAENYKDNVALMLVSQKTTEEGMHFAYALVSPF